MSCVFRGLKEKYPQHQIELITSNEYMSGSLIEIAEHNPFITKIHLIEPWHSTTTTTRQCWPQFFASPDITEELLWKIADITIDLNTACIEHESQAWLAKKIPMIPRYEIWCNRAGVIPSTYKPIYKITQEEQKIADEFIYKNWGNKRLIGVGLGACDKKRALTIGKLRQICKGLKNQGLHPITIDPTNRFEDLDYIIGKRFKELMPLIKRMDAVITVDSGLLHMAGTLDTPIIGIFGPTDPDMRMKLYRGSAINSKMLVPCAHCWYGYQCLKEQNPSLHYKCLTKIRPEIIIEETLRWVNSNPSRHPDQVNI